MATGHTFTTRAELLVARNAWCDDHDAAAVTYGPINEWNIASITDLQYIFCVGTAADCYSGCANFNDYIGGWSTSSVTTYQYAFSGATFFNQNLSAWDVSAAGSVSARSFTRSFRHAILSCRLVTVCCPAFCVPRMASAGCLTTPTL
jgi:hypothetical protein